MIRLYSKKFGDKVMLSLLASGLLMLFFNIFKYSFGTWFWQLISYAKRYVFIYIYIF